jgi:hypothetical protein
MLATLPKDVLWLIIKHHLLDMCKFMEKFMETGGPSLHEYDFCSGRVSLGARHLFEKTYDGKRTSHCASHFVDYLYPLRLVCKRIDVLMKDKITASGQFYRIKVAM